MKASEFVQEAQSVSQFPVGYYAVGDSNAASIGSSPNWQSFAQKGATSSSSLHQQAIDRIPKGSVVAISIGGDEAASGEDPRQVGSQINSIVQYAKQKGLQPVFVLFPRTSGENAQQGDMLRAAIFTSVNAPMLDMQTTSGSASPTAIAQQIQSKFVLPGFQTLGTSKVSYSGTPNASSAKQSAERYLGAKLSDSDWNMLIRATSAEASGNTREQGWVMGTILNRVRSGKWGGTLQSVLYAKNQFQSVTGTRKNRSPSPNFTRQPSASRLQSILTAAIKVLPEVPHSILNFTAASRAAYGPGTNIGYLKKLYARGGEKIGGTVFSV